MTFYYSAAAGLHMLVMLKSLFCCFASVCFFPVEYFQVGGLKNAYFLLLNLILLKVTGGIKLSRHIKLEDIPV